MRKPVFGCMQPGKDSTWSAQLQRLASLEILDIANIGNILSRQQTKALIRLRGCAGWSTFVVRIWHDTGFLMTRLIWLTGICFPVHVFYELSFYSWRHLNCHSFLCMWLFAMCYTVQIRAGTVFYIMYKSTRTWCVIIVVEVKVSNKTHFIQFFAYLLVTW